MLSRLRYGAVRDTRRWLSSAELVVVRWFKDLDVNFIMFGMLCNFCVLL
jgi:hypothetical protein